LPRRDIKKARISFQMGRYEEALAAYGEASEAWKKMADLFFEKKEGNEKVFLEKAQEARSRLGMSLFKLERYREALAIIDSALEFKHESRVEWSNKGFVLSDMGRNEEALEAFEKALSFDPESPKILTSKGIVYFRMGLPEKALETFDRALSAEPKQASDWVCKLPQVRFLFPKQSSRYEA
jgi:tetratricopeptide (TPR) repeat protein